MCGSKGSGKVMYVYIMIYTLKMDIISVGGTVDGMKMNLIYDVSRRQTLTKGSFGRTPNDS